MTTLSHEQRAGIEKIKAWHEGGGSVFRLFGPAGTGKTTMAKVIPDALGVRARFMTFTGKAAHVLQRKGVDDAATIHSSIYYPTADAEAKEALALARRELEGLEQEKASALGDVPDGWADLLEFLGALDECRERVKELEARSRRVAWEWDPDAMAGADLIVLDEVSMVDRRMAVDIERYRIPVLVLGDPAQLPPVEGGGHYIDASPDFLLEQIHRQALESPVLELATRIRLSTGADLGMTPDDVAPASIAEAMEADQVIVWSNPRRWKLTTEMRKRWGRPEGQPVPGDRIICLSNNRDLGVFNGQQFTVLAAAPAVLGPTLTLRDDDGRERVIPTFAEGFLSAGAEKAAKNSGAGIRGRRMLATFGQVITCHKSQGSEWGSVYVVNETPAMISWLAKKDGPRAAEAQARRWLYTAATRASDSVTITSQSRRR